MVESRYWKEFDCFDNTQHNEGFTEYMACPVCGYVKYCKITRSGWICRSCDRIKKEKQNAKI